MQGGAMMRSEFQKASDWWVEDGSECNRSRIGEQEWAHSRVPVRADGAFTWGDGDEDWQKQADWKHILGIKFEKYYDWIDIGG